MTEDLLLGVVGAAELFGVQRKTVRTWIRRGVAPAPRMVVDGQPFWAKDDLVAWGERTGRDLA